MFIAILVLLGIAGAIWYFARKQTQAVQNDIIDIIQSVPQPEYQETPAKEEVKQVDQVVEVPVVEVPVVEVPVVEKPAKKAVIEPVAIESTPEVVPVVSAPVVEEAKPAKKKRRYYPKKK
jgi:CO dehydrogenase/acetyl-CoA synthase delta subunit